MQQELARGSNFTITADAQVVFVRVVNRPELDPEEGARCAQAINTTLLERVLVSGSAYAGIVIDVRHAPPVFGPKTRAALEEWFGTAERNRKRIAVRMTDSAIQRLQFSSLCREHAPRFARITESDASAVDWVSGST